METLVFCKNTTLTFFTGESKYQQFACKHTGNKNKIRDFTCSF